MAAITLQFALAKDPLIRFYNERESEMLACHEYSGEDYSDILDEVRIERSEYLSKKYGIILRITSI